jgi:hypothetical protein
MSKEADEVQGASVCSACAPLRVLLFARGRAFLFVCMWTPTPQSYIHARMHIQEQQKQEEEDRKLLEKEKAKISGVCVCAGVCVRARFDEGHMSGMCV